MRTFIAVAALAAATLAPSARAQETPPSTIVETFPVFTAITNPCNGETIVLQGEERAVLHANSDAAGGTHAFFLFHSADLTATAPDGTPLDVRVVTHESFATQDPAPPLVSTATQIFHRVVITDGAEPNAVIHALLHVTIANGEPTATVETLDVDCTGPPSR